jgi:hypothetical protein
MLRRIAELVVLLIISYVMALAFFEAYLNL